MLLLTTFLTDGHFGPVIMLISALPKETATATFDYIKKKLLDMQNYCDKDREIQISSKVHFTDKMRAPIRRDISDDHSSARYHPYRNKHTDTQCYACAVLRTARMARIENANRR